MARAEVIESARAAVGAVTIVVVAVAVGAAVQDADPLHDLFAGCVVQHSAAQLQAVGTTTRGQQIGEVALLQLQKLQCQGMPGGWLALPVHHTEAAMRSWKKARSWQTLH